MKEEVKEQFMNKMKETAKKKKENKVNIVKISEEVIRIFF
jgi:hypothetical protein